MQSSITTSSPSSYRPPAPYPPPHCRRRHYYICYLFVLLACSLARATFVMPDSEHRIFTRFIMLVNESISMEGNSIHDRLTDHSQNKGHLPQVIIKSALQHLSIADRRDADRLNNLADETIPAQLITPCSSLFNQFFVHATRHGTGSGNSSHHDHHNYGANKQNCTFQIQIRNNGPLSVQIEQLKFIAFTRDTSLFHRIKKSNKVRVHVQIGKSNQQHALLFDGDIFLTISEDDHTRFESDCIRIMTANIHKYQQSKLKRARTTTKTITNANLLREHEILIIQVNIIDTIQNYYPYYANFREEALVRLMLSAPRKTRKTREVNGIFMHEHYSRTHVLANGCIMRTYVWNFNDPQLIEMIMKEKAMNDVFKSTGYPVGVYEISYCTNSDQTSCIEPRSDVIRKGNRLDNMMNDIRKQQQQQHNPQESHWYDSPSSIYYLQHYINSELHAKGIIVGCCHPTQYKDILLYFSGGTTQNIEHANAASCACLQNFLNIPPR